MLSSILMKREPTAFCFYLNNHSNLRRVVGFPTYITHGLCPKSSRAPWVRASPQVRRVIILFLLSSVSSLAVQFTRRPGRCPQH
jgi:hypothetical protein